MILLFDLFFLSFSSKCTYQILPKLGQPYEETYDVDEGEHICINSTGNYFNVLFHNSLLSVRYFTSQMSKSQSTSNNVETPINKKLVEAGKFLFPAEKGGVSFSKNVFGSVDVTALIPGSVTISTFTFPDECTLGRYVSTETSLDLHIAETFGPYSITEENSKEQQSLCIWYAQNEYTLQASISPSQNDQILVCSSYINCEKPISRTQQYAEISSNKFIKVIPKTKDFWTDLNLIFSTEKPSNLFQISGSMKDDDDDVSYHLAMKKIVNEDDEKDDDDENQAKDNDNNNNDDTNNINDNDNDNFNNEVDNNNGAHNKNNVIERGHRKKARHNNNDSYGTLVIFLSVFVCLFIVSSLIVYLLSQSGPCSKNRNGKDDHSEERLLPNNQGFFPGYPMSWGQHQPGQGFFTGVFPFANAPGQPQPSQQQIQYITSPGATFQNVPNFTQDNQTDQDPKNNENDNTQQMPFQQPMIYVVPPQFQQQYLQQQQQYMQQYQQNLQQQNNENQQNQPQQQNQEQ